MALPSAGLIYEIASGTGQHVVHFALQNPGLTWQPTDLDGESFSHCAKRIAASGCQNIREPIVLDVHDEQWPQEKAAGLVCINMIHIAPWSATENLFRGAAQILLPSAPMVLYGPYRRNGEHTAPSNAAFDENLKSRNPEWGVRDLEDVVSVASAHGIELESVKQMPANNFAVVFRRNGAS